MSLQRRLFLAIAAALMASLVLGGTLAGWRAHRSVLAELSAALDASARTVRAGLDEASLATDPHADARRLVAAFAPNRHVRAELLGEEAQPALPIKEAAPEWVVRLLAPRLAPMEIAGGTGASRVAIRLRADARNEVGEVWRQFGDAAAALAVFCTLTVVFGALAIRRALRPVGRVAAGLCLVGTGDYSARLAGGSSSELRPLVEGFNRMAALLEDARRRNARLSEQVLLLQEEERAELARDLHDDIGPALFAVSLTAATIGRRANELRDNAIANHADTIGTVTAQMQRSVKSLLGRLRPMRRIEAGLQPAMDALVSFWRDRNPGIDFDLQVTADDADLDERQRETIFLVVQEAVVNAIRHGRPHRIGIVILRQPGAVSVSITDDGAGPDACGQPGFGLELMQERVAALQGTLLIGERDQRRGWSVDARLPA